MMAEHAGSGRRACTASVTPSFAFGLLLMLAGVALTLEQFRVVDAERVLVFWPLAIVAFGLVVLGRRSDAHRRFWGAFWIFVGTWLLLNSLRIVTVPVWALFWPVVLTAIGTGLVIKALRRGGGVPRPVPARAENLVAVFGEASRRLEHRPFDGAYLTSFLGNCRLDLRQSIIADGAAQAVEVVGMFAEVRIIVPSHWDVVLDVTPILGEVNDRHAPARTDSTSAATAPRLVVRGTIVLGQVTVDDA
jgi:predicted membrane protein